MRMLLIGLAALALGAGCSIVTQQDQQMIHLHRLNAEAVAAKALAIQMPTTEDWAATQAWWTAEAQTWVYLDAWAKGEKPAGAP